MQTKKPTIGIIGTVGLPACYGGFETLTQHLVEELSYANDFIVYCSGKTYKGAQRKTHYNSSTRLVYLPFNANGAQSIVYDCVSMIHALVFADVLLVLGISGCFFLPLIRLISSKRIVINIDGQEWRRPKWNKYIAKFLKLSEAMAVYFADEVITDNQGICDYVKSEYGKDSTVIEYGADHVSKVLISPRHLAQFPFLANDYAFKVCRIEPENNVEMILETFAQANNMPLVLVGNWQVSEFSRQLKQKYATHPNLFLLEAIYDADLLNALRSNAAIYVHGHSAGGTNPSLVEAMYLGLPIFSFDVCYNRETTEHKALFFNNSTELGALLATTSLATLRANRQTMRQIAYRRYNWNRIANCYTATFFPTPVFAPVPVMNVVRMPNYVEQRQAV
jgi:glycosyltransferase involved in cell wall biosynthesis